MSLPWFAFDVSAYLKNTMRLNTEAHGCYLLLMLDYYATGKPCPDDDDQLAAVTKIPVELWRDRYRKMLMPLFDVRDGAWFHARIEEEIAAATERHAKAVAKAAAGANARWSRKASPEHAPSMQQASLEDAHSTITYNSLSTDRDGLKEPITEPPPDPVEERPLTPIGLGFQPPAEVRAECLTWMDASSLHLEIQKFVYDAREKGKLSADWDASFLKWIERFRAFSNKPTTRGKPRVQLNPDLPTGDQPVKINWDFHLSRWLKNESGWSRRTAGPEPGQVGCRVPLEMFEKYGIDPTTGRKKREDVE